MRIYTFFLNTTECTDSSKPTTMEETKSSFSDRLSKITITKELNFCGDDENKSSTAVQKPPLSASAIMSGGLAGLSQNKTNIVQKPSSTAVVSSIDSTKSIDRYD